MKKLLTFVIIMILTISISEFSFGQSKTKTKSKSSTTKTQTVKGYTKKNGTKVKSYKRSPRKKTSSFQILNESENLVFFTEKEKGLIEMKEFEFKKWV